MTQIQMIPIKQLTLLEDNPRKIDKDQFSKLVASLESDPGFLDCRPILVNRVPDAGKLLVYAGNQRVRAAKKLGWKEVACIVEDDLEDEVMKKRTILDNKHNGEWDFDLLAANFEIDMLIDCGFTPEELTGDYGDVEDVTGDEEDNEQIEPPKDEDAITKLGDLFELNGHRLVCGDSTLPEYTEKALSGLEPVLMVTDPPYGVEYDPNFNKKKTDKKLGKVLNDDNPSWGLSFMHFTGSVAYVWSSDKFAFETVKSLVDCEYKIINQIIWGKPSLVLGRGDYHSQHEPCWYAVKKGHNHNWKGDRKQNTLWQIEKVNNNSKSQDERTDHGTQKPLECMSRPIINHTDKGDYVYDPFLGSGTTLIASEKLDRKCIGLELSPAYCDIIIKRWIKIRQKNQRDAVVIRNGKVSREY